MVVLEGGLFKLVKNKCISALRGGAEIAFYYSGYIKYLHDGLFFNKERVYDSSRAAVMILATQPGEQEEKKEECERKNESRSFKKARIPIFHFEPSLTLIFQVRHHVIDLCKPWHPWLIFKFPPEIVIRQTDHMEMKVID